METSQLIEAINRFTFNLQKQHNGQPICGINVFSCLLMAAYAFDSTSRQEILQALCLGDASIRSAARSLKNFAEDIERVGNLLNANSMWHRPDRTLTPQFRDAMQDFKVVVGAIDRDAIARFIYKATQGLIDPDVSVSSDMALMLYSCFYFKGNWKTPFDGGNTFSSTFYTFQGDSVPCDMMTMSDLFNYLETSTYQALILPYELGDMTVLQPHWAALFVLSKIPTEAGLHEAIAGVTQDPHSWSLLSESCIPTGMDIYIPKFSLATKSDFIPSLRRMGVSSALHPSLDFWATSPREDTWISNIEHMVYLKCDELGTEVAAVTECSAEDGLDEGNVHFMLDRPFWMAVFDQVSKVVLCSGVVQDVGGIDRATENYPS